MNTLMRHHEPAHILLVLSCQKIKRRIKMVFVKYCECILLSIAFNPLFGEVQLNVSI